MNDEFKKLLDEITQRLTQLTIIAERDPWKSIKEHGLPPEGVWYDAYTWTREGHRTVRELFFDGDNEYGIHWLGEGDWPYPVTHYCERPDPPREEHE